MNDSILCTVQGGEGLADYVLAALGQNLNRHVIRNKISFDECA